MSVGGRTSAYVVTAVLAGSMLAGPAAAAPAPARVGAHPAVPTSASVRLAGKRWTHKVQVDGKGGLDTVVIEGGKDIKLDSFGIGFGHIIVRVHLAGSRRTVSSRQFIGYFSVRKPWTPWLGATNLDHRGGKELVLGFSTGAHSQLFTALTYRNGHLRVLDAPGSSSWFINSSFGTGSAGWRCTANGVQGRGVAPIGTDGKRFRVTRNTFVRRSNHWVRTQHFTAVVDADANGNPPASTNSYPRFSCPGLPLNVL